MSLVDALGITDCPTIVDNYLLFGRQQTRFHRWQNCKSEAKQQGLASQTHLWIPPFGTICSIFCSVLPTPTHLGACAETKLCEPEICEAFSSQRLTQACRRDCCSYALSSWTTLSSRRLPAARDRFNSRCRGTRLPGDLECRALSPRRNMRPQD